jgi:NAD(P)-dependent dehydrogenase (short-subunit alcohol dehydrogenase family)
VIELTAVLAKEHKDKNILINAACPGYLFSTLQFLTRNSFVSTDINGHTGTKTVEQGLESYFAAAQFPKESNINGAFFSEKLIAKQNDFKDMNLQNLPFAAPL